jgi:hypothetical protein
LRAESKACSSGATRGAPRTATAIRGKSPE